ncbi:hypothetical protein EVA_11005 [gut metagenome]|uniref:Uncharacterized protein n=1 Tax=gut metagenome TaxID=749906 RepID=J9G211_9ZZZZ
MLRHNEPWLSDEDPNNDARLLALDVFFRDQRLRKYTEGYIAYQLLRQRVQPRLQPIG